MNDLKIARGLGWLSLAIAATEIFGRRTVEKNLLGIDRHPVLMPAMGVREAVAGVTILSQRRITPTLAAGLWSRVAGDALDLSLLAAAAPTTRKPKSFTTNLLTVAAITAVDVYYAARISRRLMMAKYDQRQRIALDHNISAAAQPPPEGVPSPL